MTEFKIKITLTLIAFIWLIDLYSWQGIKTLIRFRWQQQVNKIRLIYFGLAISFSILAIMANFSQFMQTNMQARTLVSSLIFIVYLSKFLLCIFLFIDDLLRGLKWILRKLFPKKRELISEPKSVETINRATFLSQVGAITAGIPLVLLTKGIFKGAYDYQIVRVPLYIKNLPLAFRGLKIIQLSDIHTGSLLDRDAVHKGIQLAMNEKPDIAFFTGDLVNNQTNEALPLMEHFSEIKAPMGVYSIFGNHDYGDYMVWENEAQKVKNLSDLVGVHKDMGWNLLRNEHVMLERGGNKMALIGVENWGDRGRFQKYGDLEKAMQGMPSNDVKLLLSHDPSHFDNIVSKQHPDIAATFSGHTHGFQFGVENDFIKWSPSQYIYPHWAGLYIEGKQQIYVNRGFGFLGYPGRVGILPEITLFELREA
jgi:predicted MPP superfamily phosphohydrolase